MLYGCSDCPRGQNFCEQCFSNYTPTYSLTDGSTITSCTVCKAEGCDKCPLLPGVCVKCKAGYVLNAKKDCDYSSSSTLFLIILLAVCVVIFIVFFFRMS